MDESQQRLSAPATALLAWLLAAAVNGVLLRSGVPAEGSVLWLVHLYDAGQMIGMGMASLSLAAVWQRWGRGGRWGRMLAASAVALLMGAWILPRDLDNLASRLGEQLGHELTLVLLVGGASLILPITLEIALAMARPWLRWVVVLSGVAAVAVNGFILPMDYEGAHMLLLLAATTAMGAALTGAVFPKRLEPVATLLRRRWLRDAVLALFAAYGAYCLVMEPPGAAALAWSRWAGSPLPMHLARLRTLPDQLSTPGHVRVPNEEWYRDRSDLPPIPPSPERLLPEDGLVIWFTVDALRHDVVFSRKYDERIPTIAKIRDSSVAFTNAHAPGTLTKYTVTSMFMGKYFSQQYWVQQFKTKTPFKDPSKRFPELLSAAGVTTVNITGCKWLRNYSGIVKGFDEEQYVPYPKKKSYYTPSEPIVDVIIERLRKVEHKPFFLHSHFMDAHAPYKLGGREGSDFERYLKEVELVDASIARLQKALRDEGLEKRTALVITADHGEAFGEHGARTHGTTMYGEVMHVPLLIHLPEAKHRTVDQLVSLMDLGPTVLDLFGQPTPAHFMGQSLVPLLAGLDVELTRPVLSETRMMRALVMPDGRKLIVDLRRRTTELYDLEKDPAEEHNLADDPKLLQEPQQRMNAFFETHTNKTPGYKVPFVR